MSIPAKSLWRAVASSGEARLAIDDLYATAWASAPETQSWFAIDLGEVSILGGLEVYWGKRWADVYAIEASLDGRVWTPLCRTRHGEGGQNVFAFPPTRARQVRLTAAVSDAPRALDIVEINLYHPEDAMAVREAGCLPALGGETITLPVGASLTVDFGYMRLPLGALIEWGDTWGTVFSVHLSDDGESFREVGRILTSRGDYDNFYWRSTRGRYFRLTIHEASSLDGAVIRELKLRLLNKDRMPIGQLESAARAGRGELYPQALLGRQVYWTALGEIDQDEEALFDEYGNIEPRLASGQWTPLLRLDGRLHGAPAGVDIRQTLAEGSLPIAAAGWNHDDIAVEVTALAEAGQACVEYRLVNAGAIPRRGALIVALRPAQINPYWQHGGHAVIDALALTGARVEANGRPVLAFSRAPDAWTLADFDGGDVVRLIESGPLETPAALRSGTGLLSGAFEFDFSLGPGASATVMAALPLRDGITPEAGEPFAARRERVTRAWRDRLGSRRITVGDREIGDTVEAQIALILVNATRHAFKPGPRNYDRTWIRDGSSQALALLWAGLLPEAQRYVRWYARRIYPDGLVPPILNPDGSVNMGYGSNIEFDAQGEFVGIAAECHRIGRDRDFLDAIFEPALRATRFIDVLRARTNAEHGPGTRYHGLVAPSISHEGYNKPTYSYWDDFFALAAWRDLEYLATEIGDAAVVEEARSKGRRFAADLARSMRMTADAMVNGLMPASADREDVDPTSTSIAFEPCRVDDVLPADRIAPTYDEYRRHLDVIADPAFEGGFTPYEIRNLNAFVALDRNEDAFTLLRQSLTWRRPPGWRGWAEVAWGNTRAPEYIGDMPHTWIGAEFATAIRRMLLRENGTTLELLRAVPDEWWAGEGIALRDLPTRFGIVQFQASRATSTITLRLSLTGPQPERVSVRCPGARSALADGKPRDIVGDRITGAPFGRLVIELDG